MRSFNLEAQQIITNKANNKQDFTFCLKNKNKRFIVGTKNIYKGVNPSLKFSLISDISNVLKNCNFDSIGGWQDKNTGIYYLDANTHFDVLEEAILAGKENKEVAIYDIKENKVINL